MRPSAVPNERSVAHLHLARTRYLLAGPMDDARDAGLAALASQLGLGVLTTSAGRVVTANGAFCELIGYSEPELRELPTAAVLFNAESRSLLPELYAQGSVGAITTSREMTIVDRHGDEIPTTIGLALAPAPNATVHAVALVRDLRADRATLEQLNRMMLVGDKIGTGIIVWDGSNVGDPLELRLVFANQPAQAILRMDLDEAFGKSI